VRAEIVLSSPIAKSPRVLQVGGMFDVPPSEKSEVRLEADLPLEERPWNVGLVVGPSGCGKSSLARHFWPAEMARTFAWSKDRSLLDDFPAELGIKDLTALLSSVGFSSPPSWVRPFHVLSNGEQFRVSMARLLAELPQLAVVDEFTSVVDRTVAQIGSHAVQKTVRRLNQKLVAVSCHDDVEQWLNPDWVYRPAESRFAWRELQRRPAIELQVNRVHHSAWRIFRRHHYLTAAHSKAAVCFIAFWRGRPVAWHSWLPFVGKVRRPTKRGHRTVCLPDYQGVGIGLALREFTSSMWRGLGFRVICNTAHPAEIAANLRSPNYRMIRGPSLAARDGGKMRHMSVGRARATTRLVSSFEFVGPEMERERARDVLETWARVSW